MIDSEVAFSLAKSSYHAGQHDMLASLRDTINAAQEHTVVSSEFARKVLIELIRVAEQAVQNEDLPLHNRLDLEKAIAAALEELRRINVLSSLVDPPTTVPTNMRDESP